MVCEIFVGTSMRVTEKCKSSDSMRREDTAHEEHENTRNDLRGSRHAVEQFSWHTLTTDVALYSTKFSTASIRRGSNATTVNTKVRGSHEMTLLGRILKNRKGRDIHSAWNLANLQGPELLIVTSEGFAEGEHIPLEFAGKRIGGKNLSPDLTWSSPPSETIELVLVVEDLDVPISKPAVHCLALIDPLQLDSPNYLPAGGLSADRPATGVRILRSTIGRGYHGPEPIKGHGPHRYVFQLFALASSATTNRATSERARPRTFFSSITAPVIARGRLTGVYER
jgi:phosphatidylethanolamine-binding protein (PEBP) family uncharacterized protein